MSIFFKDNQLVEDGWDDDDDLNLDDDDNNGLLGNDNNNTNNNDGWDDDGDLDLDFDDDDDDPPTKQQQPPPPPPPIPATSDNDNAFGAGFTFKNNGSDPSIRRPPPPPPPNNTIPRAQARSPPPRAEQNGNMVMGVSTSKNEEEEENGWGMDDDDLDLDLDFGDDDGGDDDHQNNIETYNNNDDDINLVVGHANNERREHHFGTSRIAPETPEHEITFYTEESNKSDDDNNNIKVNESSDDGWGDDGDFFVDDDDDDKIGMPVVGGISNNDIQQQQQQNNNNNNSSVGDTQEQQMIMHQQPPVDVKLTEIQEQLENYVSSLDRIVWSINAVLEFEYSTTEKAQELVDYYSSRRQLAEYTRTKELPRMEYSVVLPYGHVETSKDEIRAQYLPDESILARCANQSLLADLLHQITGPDLIVRPAFLAVCVAHWCKFTIHLAGNLGGEDMVDCACRLHLSLPTVEGERLNLAEIAVQIIFKPNEPIVEYRVLSIDVLLKDDDDKTKSQQLEGVAQFLNMIEGHFDEFPGHEDMQLHNAPADKYRDVFLENSQKLLTQSTMGMKSALQQMESVVNLRQKLNIVKGGYKTISKFIPDTDQLLAAEEEARNVVREREQQLQHQQQQQQQQQNRNHFAPPPPPVNRHPHQPPTPPPPPNRPPQMAAPPQSNRPNEAARPTSILGGFVSSGWNALAKSMAIPDDDPDIYGATTAPSAQSDQQPALYQMQPPPATTNNEGFPPKVYHREEPAPSHQFPRPPKEMEKDPPTLSHREESTPQNQFPRPPKPVEERPAFDGVSSLALTEQHSAILNNRQSFTTEPHRQPPPPPPPPPKIDTMKQGTEGENAKITVPGPPPPAMNNASNGFGSHDEEQPDAVNFQQGEQPIKKVVPPPPPIVNADNPAAATPLQRLPAPPSQTLSPTNKTSKVAPSAPFKVGNVKVGAVESTDLKQPVTVNPLIDNENLNQIIVANPSTESAQSSSGVISEGYPSSCAETPLEDSAEDSQAQEATRRVPRKPAIVDVDYNSDDDIIETCKRWRNPRPYRPYYE